MTAPLSRRRGLVVGLVVALVVVRVVAIVVLLGSGIESERSILGGDARRYEAIVGAPGTPYLDHEVEYPPVAVGLMAVVDRPTTLGTLVALAVSQLALELAVAGLLAWAWSRRTGVVYLVLGTPMVLYPFLYVRIDLLAVFLAVLALALLRRGRPTGSGMALAAAVYAKVWPLVLGPRLFLAGHRRAPAAFVATGVVGLVLWVAWAGTGGIGQIIGFRGATGWQIESLPGIVLHALDPAASTVQQGAWRTGVDATTPARVALTVIGLTAVALAWWWAQRAARLARQRGDDTTVTVVLDGLGPLAAVLAMVVCSTIISPQYVLWFVPFAAVVAAGGDRTVAALTLAAVTTSTLGLLWIHGLVDGDALPVATVLVRNLALFALLVRTLQGLVRLASGPAVPPAGADEPSTSPVAVAPGGPSSQPGVRPPG